MHDKLIVRISFRTTARYRRFEPIDCTVRTYGTVLPGVRLNLNGCKWACTQAFFKFFFNDSSSGQPTEHKCRLDLLGFGSIHVGKDANMNSSQTQVNSTTGTLYGCKSACIQAFFKFFFWISSNGQPTEHKYRLGLLGFGLDPCRQVRKHESKPKPK